MARGLPFKTPEEIEQERLMQQELYPESIPTEIDPTAGNRQFAFDQLKKLIPKNSAAGQSIQESELQDEAPSFEMSPEIKQYGYDLFGLGDMAGDQQQEIPFAPEEQPQELPEETPVDDQLRSPAAQDDLRSVDEEVDDWLKTSEEEYWKKQKNQMPEQDQLRSPANQVKPELPKEEDVGVESIIKKTREEEDRADFLKSVAKFRDAVMGAGSGRILKDTDYSMYDEMRTKAQRPIQDLLLKNELQDKKAKNDPNSDISKLMRKTLEEVGIDMSNYPNVSYTQLEKIYPSLANTIATKIAAEARKDQQKLAAQLRADAAADKKSEKDILLKEKRLNELTKRTDNVLKSDEYKLYNQTKPTLALLDEATRKWDSEDESYKETAQAAFMGYAKAAQQDPSVVRESDMRVLAGGINYGNLGGLMSKLVAKGQGASFSPDELEAFKAVVKTIQEVKRNDLRQRFDPIFKRASEVELSDDYFLSPDIKQDIYSPVKKEVDPIQQQLKDLEAKLNANQSRIEILRNKRNE
jgi:hypothetical protein